MLVINIKKTSLIFICLFLASSTALVAFNETVKAIPGPSRIWSRELVGPLIVQSSPSTADIDGGVKDIIVGTWNSNSTNAGGQIYGVRGEDGNDVSGWPKNVAKRVNGSAAVADVNNNGNDEIFVGSGVAEYECSGGGMYSFTNTGSQRFRFVGYDNVTNGGAAPCYDLAMHGSPALGDINYDGVTDVNFGALGIRTWSIKSTGAYENFGWWYDWDDTQFASPALADLDGNGLVEVIAGGDQSPQGKLGHQGGLVRALSGWGQELWQFRTNEIVYSSPAVGDVDGDGKPEVVFGTGNFWADNSNGGSDSTKIFVLNHAGKLQWVKDLGAQTLASPALADADGDGRLDIVIGTKKGFGTSQLTKLWALQGSNGTNINGYPIAQGKDIVGQVSTADFNNDGGQDILVNTGDGVYCYSGKNGSLLFTIRSYGSFQNSPLIEDLDGNGNLEIIIAGIDRYINNGTTPVSVVERWEMPDTSANLGSMGWPKFRKDARQTGSWLATDLRKPPSGNVYEGYWMAGANGQIYSFGSAKDYGSAANLSLAKPIVGMSSTPDGKGYYLLGGDGGIFTYGNASFKGSTGNLALKSPVLGIANTTSGNGYWLVAGDGGIFTFGDAKFKGSTGAMTLNKPIVGMAPTPTGNGYWLVASDGGIFTFGDAKFKGSTGAMTLNKPIVGMAPTPTGNGYWLVASDGGIFTFGDAKFKGSTGNLNLISPITGMAPFKNGGDGYWLVAKDGGIFTFGSGGGYYGSLGGANINRPITAISNVGQ